MGFTQILIMVIAGIGMLVGLAKEKQGAEWGKPVAIGCIVVALIAALWGIISTARGPSTEGVVAKEMQFQRAGGEKLGTYLAEKFSGSKVLLLTEPKLSTGEARPSAMLDGFKKAIEGKLTIAAEISPEIPADKARAFASEMPMEGAEGGEMLPPLEYWFTAKIFDEIVTKHEGQFDLLVTNIGLPQDGARNSKILKDKAKRPKIAFLSGSIYDLRGAISPEMIVAAVTYNPKAVYDDKPVPRNLDEAFSKRYLLVTPETMQQVVSTTPEIFRSR